MPANLTPQYMEAEKRFKQAGSIEEKVAALEEMMATIPRHKGTEKLQAELKKKMSALRKESEEHKKGGRRESFVIEREGARQLALVGAPNSGKSQLLRMLTNATPEVADYPYTTRIPIPGMLTFENVRLQLIDLPPISAEYTESWVPQVIRNADAVLWIIDLADDDILDRIEETTIFLSNAHTDLSAMEVLMVGNKSDAPAAADRLGLLKEACPGRVPIITISAATATPKEIEAFKRLVYDFLGVVRVYTKVPGKKPDFSDPYVVDKGSTVLDVAEKVHRDFVESLKYARIWGEGKADGIMVPRDFVISEGDILELHV
jgi:ribosome-interacting GTPase 1